MKQLHKLREVHEGERSPVDVFRTSSVNVWTLSRPYLMCNHALLCRILTITITNDSSIFLVNAIMIKQSCMAAVLQILFISRALEPIKRNRTGSLTKMSVGLFGGAVSELAAYDLGVVHVPGIITDSWPRAVDEDLNTTRKLIWTIDKPNCSYKKRKCEKEKKKKKKCYVDIPGI